MLINLRIRLIFADEVLKRIKQSSGLYFSLIGDFGKNTLMIFL